MRDFLKDDVKKVLNDFKSFGVKIYFLIGDKKEVVEKIVKCFLIDGVFLEFLLEEKVRVVEKIKFENKE